MASTRRAAQVHIYQDPYNNDDVESALLQALAPLGDASNKHNLVFEPSTSRSRATSPRKSHRHSSSPAGQVSRRGLNGISLPPPHQPGFNTDSPTKNASYYPNFRHAAPSQQLPSSTLFSSFPSTHNMDKENVYHNAPFDQPSMQYQDAVYGYKAPLKRTLMDAAPLKDKSNNKKLKSEDDESLVLPDPEEMPSVDDDGTKPSHSYAVLIGMAILRSPNRRLTLAQIYKWISDHYTFYKSAEPGWQNSIRHNLSLNKAFIKQERPKDDPGKGNYWAIEAGKEHQFLKDRPLRKIVTGDNQTFMQAMQHDLSNVSRSSSAPAIGHFALGPHPSKKFETRAIDSSKFPDEPFSSDGTIPASDPALQDDDQQDSLAMPPPAARHMRSSPPPQEIGSSPPPMHADPESDRQATPPALPRFSSASRSDGRKQKFAPVNDSGYYSSIESSVTRGPAHAHVLPTSEADHERHRMKRGRAEEEIARIRSSSYDSPTKDKAHGRKPSVHFETSSPKRPGTSSGMPPLTPAVVFKRPIRPPPSISPNTNLRNHRNRIRKLLGDSPMKTMTPMRENEHSWSPHFSLADNMVSPVKQSTMTPFRDSLFNNAFDLFDNDDLSSRGSPEKRRPKFERAATSAGILAEITGSGIKANAPGLLSKDGDSPFNAAFSPYKMTPSYVARSPVRLGSPLKRSIDMTPSFASAAGDHAPDWLDLSLENLFGLPEGAASKTPRRAHDDLFGAELPSDGGSEEGVDILQEFGKIGAHIGAPRPTQQQQQQRQQVQMQMHDSSVKRSVRPPMGRSVTSRF